MTLRRSNLGLIGLAAAASMAMAGCTTTSPGYGYGGPPPASSTANCYDCGTVTRIDMIAGSGTSVPNATGAVLGGIVGAAAGRELADDESEGRQNTATVAGAVAGAVAGNAIQNRVQANNDTYSLTVRMQDGRSVVVTQGELGGIREGSYVRVYNGRAWLR
ncbi:MAG TPA: glycine zipper 2TM domain-containing protein [Xanthomonadaceae bacterium]|nr:glycine zipper 2TM domain-containing protein [Xanthomonadaceae bacterium]